MELGDSILGQIHSDTVQRQRGIQYRGRPCQDILSLHTAQTEQRIDLKMFHGLGQCFCL